MAKRAKKEYIILFRTSIQKSTKKNMKSTVLNLNSAGEKKIVHIVPSQPSLLAFDSQFDMAVYPELGLYLSIDFGKRLLYII